MVKTVHLEFKALLDLRAPQALTPILYVMAQIVI